MIIESFTSCVLCGTYDDEEGSTEDCHKLSNKASASSPHQQRSTSSIESPKTVFDIAPFLVYAQRPYQTVKGYDDRASLYRLSLDRIQWPPVVEKTSFKPTILEDIPPALDDVHEQGSANEYIKFSHVEVTEKKFDELLLAGWILEDSFCRRCDVAYLSQYPGAPKQCINCNDKVHFGTPLDEENCANEMTAAAIEKSSKVVEERDNNNDSDSAFSSLSESTMEEIFIETNNTILAKSNSMQCPQEREESEPGNVMSILAAGDPIVAKSQQQLAPQDSMRMHMVLEHPYEDGQHSNPQELYERPSRNPSQGLHDLPSAVSNSSKNALTHCFSISVATPQPARVPAVKSRNVLPRCIPNYITCGSPHISSCSVSSVSGSHIPIYDVVSDTLVAIFTQLDHAKEKLKASSSENRVEIFQLIEKLTSAAVAMKKLEKC